jgi:DNA-directed RNA polymerase specialized sigma24 family protein
MPDPSDPTIDVPADAQRFAQAVLPHVDAAYNLARWLSGDAQDADDIVQDACLRAFRLFGGFRGGDGRPWLLAIVRNTWFSECARRKQARELLPPPRQPRHHGADRHVDDGGNVPIRQVFQLAQHDHLAVRQRQPRQGSLHAAHVIGAGEQRGGVGAVGDGLVVRVA